MKRPGHLLALLSVLVSGSLSIAQETPQIPHLDFVRALRSQYGPGLADDYLKRLQQTAPSEFTPRLALELAVIKLEMAEKAATAGERVRLTREAEVEINKYNGPEAALLGVKILNLQARALTTRARREGGEGEKRGLAQAAGVYQQVENRLKESIKQLDAEIAKVDPKNAKEKKALEDSRLQAEFDLGVCLFDYALAANPGIQADAKRNADLEKARNVFDKLAAHTPPGAAAMQAAAWVGRCFLEGGLRDEAPKAFKRVMQDRNGYSEAGRRLAEYFSLLQVLRLLDKLDPSLPNDSPAKDAFTLSELWFREHADQLATPQAATVHYILGRAYFEEAGKLPPNSLDAKKKEYQKALEQFRKAEQIENDYSSKARFYKLLCFAFVQGWGKEAALDERKLEEAAAAVDIQKLTAFEDLYDRSQFEMARMREAIGKAPAGDAKAAEAIRKKYLARVIEALERAIAVAEKKDSKVAEESANQARLLLTYAYMASENAADTIAYGKKLAEERVTSPQAPDAAIYVLQGYAILFRQLKAKKDEEGLAKFRAEYHKFLDHVMKFWPEDQAGDVARHQKGMALYDEKRLPEAIEALAQIRPTYSSYIVARFQLAVMELNNVTDQEKPTEKDPDRRFRIGTGSLDALNAAGVPDAVRAKLKPLLDKTFSREQFQGEIARVLDKAELERWQTVLFTQAELKWKERAILVLEELPPLAPGTDPSLVETYVRAKLQLAQPYQAAGKFKEMEATFPPMLDALAQGVWSVPSEEVKKDLLFSLTKVLLWTAYSKADKYVEAAVKKDPRAIAYPETRPFFDPVYLLFVKDSTLQLMKEDEKFRLGFMDLILKAYLLDGKSAQAAELVRFLIKCSPEKSDGGALEVVEPLVNQMIAYTAELRARYKLMEMDGKKQEAAAKKAEADKLTAAFVSFLDELAKAPQALNPEYFRLLAKGYLSVEQPAKATALSKTDPGAPGKDAPPRKLQAYVDGRVLYIRALREEKKLDEAEAALNELKKSDKQELFTKDVFFRMEEARILDERKKYKEAFKSWRDLANQLAPNIYRQKRDKELFFECYCHYVESGYRFGLTLEEPKKTKLVKDAANEIVKLESRDPELGGEVSRARFQRLLENEAPLKEQYAAIKEEKK
jgi:hypothetical protein